MASEMVKTDVLNPFKRLCETRQLQFFVVLQSAQHPKQRFWTSSNELYNLCGNLIFEFATYVDTLSDVSPDSSNKNATSTAPFSAVYELQSKSECVEFTSPPLDESNQRISRHDSNGNESFREVSFLSSQPLVLGANDSNKSIAEDSFLKLEVDEFDQSSVPIIPEATRVNDEDHEPTFACNGEIPDNGNEIDENVLLPEEGFDGELTHDAMEDGYLEENDSEDCAIVGEPHPVVASNPSETDTQSSPLPLGLPSKSEDHPNISYLDDDLILQTSPSANQQTSSSEQPASNVDVDDPFRNETSPTVWRSHEFERPLRPSTVQRLFSDKLIYSKESLCYRVSDLEYSSILIAIMKTCNPYCAFTPMRLCRCEIMQLCRCEIMGLCRCDIMRLCRCEILNC